MLVLPVWAFDLPTERRVVAGVGVGIVTVLVWLEGKGKEREVI